MSLVSCFAGYIETADNGYLEVVKLLIESGVNIHAKNEYALRKAAENGYLEVVKFLIKSEADIHAENDYALTRAAGNNYLEVVKFLIESGANIHAENDYALRWAVFLYLYFAEQNKILGTHSVACILQSRIHRNC